MTALINQELAKIEKRDRAYGGRSVDPAMDVVREAWEMGKEQRAWNERKNLQRQKMMALATEGWDSSTDINSLGKKVDWLNNYRSKNQGNMDDITLEYADMLQEQIGNRSQRITNLHTDIEMLDQNKEQWLGIADELKDRPLGADDYNALSESIGQYIKMKQDMLVQNADFLALPQFEHVKQDMIGQEYIINEIFAEAKDQNVFNQTEYDWTTRALRDGNYTMIEEKRQERLEDKKRNIADIVGQIEPQMSLYRRIQEIKKGGRAPLPELFGEDSEKMMVGLEDLGYEKNPDGDIVATEAKTGIFGGVSKDEEALEGIRSQWGLLAGYGDVQGKAERDLRNMDAIYERESGTGNKYTVGKHGFENFYADPTKPAETQDDNYKHISDNGGYINVNNAVDQDPEGYGVGEVVVGAGAAGAAIHANWDKISKTKDSALKYLKDVGFLLEDDIVKLYSDPKTARFMDALNKQTDKLNAIDKNANPKEYLRVLKKHQQIVNQANKHLFPMFNEKLMKDFNNAEADLRRIIAEANSPAHENYGNKKLVTDARNKFNALQEKVNKKNKGMLELLKNPGKWNLWKMKAGRGIQGSYRTVKDLVKIGGKTFGKLTPLDAAMWGWFLGDKVGMESISAKAATAGGTYMGAKQLMNWMSRKGGVTNALMNPTLQSKIAGYLIRKAPGLALKMGLKMGVGLAGTVFTGGLGTGIGVAMAAWTGKDIYNLIQDVPEIKQYIVEYLNGDYDEVGEMRKKGMTAVGTPGFLPK